MCLYMWSLHANVWVCQRLRVAAVICDSALRGCCAWQARQVLEVFPDVPLDIVHADLQRTRSVELTIENLIEGTVQIPPVSQAAPHTVAAHSTFAICVVASVAGTPVCMSVCVS